MAYNEALTKRVREAFAGISDVEEKKMFRGITFMVNGKMCVGVSGDELMCRIDPEVQTTVMEKEGVRLMMIKGRPMMGFVYVSEENVRSKKDFDFWIHLALDFNPNAKPSKKKKK
ncbi:MAG TPA: TfoX/Sxy family protein [Candidatus Kapabacteria bacterium]|jgi:TfoX/Sxy family transcriptional regulator of competence genes|nr:TfoX/Sxy family protein [Candidatus Kapabacteria bacterium]